MPEPIVDRMQKIMSLAKRRGFVFQSSEIYGGLKSTYDYGPLGCELKRNIAQHWWQQMVHEREDVVGLDAAILMHPKVWETSGHIDGFSDPLVDCYQCQERFRADHAQHNQDQQLICPHCGSLKISPMRQFNLMFRTHIGAVDIADQLAQAVQAVDSQNPQLLRQALMKVLNENAVYLRPETAQSMFVQFANVQQSMSLKIPFGIAQIGKSFRNEITVEHFIFRSCEFEQMEMEYFVEPGSEELHLQAWVQRRLEFWQKLANDQTSFRTRAHTAAELAHYATACYDIEYDYPWGFGELEGIACRGDYDLRQHEKASGKSLQYFDPQKINPVTQKPGWHYLPKVIEPAAGLTRAVLVFLLDAYHEEAVATATAENNTRVVLKLHPQLAPIKAAVLPLVKKEKLPELGRTIAAACLQAGLIVRYDETHAIGRRYRRHDEIGTPYCVTLDHQSMIDQTVTVRERDSMRQERIGIAQIINFLQDKLQRTALGVLTLGAVQAFLSP